MKKLHIYKERNNTKLPSCQFGQNYAFIDNNGGINLKKNCKF